MKYKEIHAEVYKDISSSEVVLLIPAENIFYFFPPKDALSVLPRVHFRLENIKSNSGGDDTEVINEARLVVDVYSKDATFNIVDVIVDSVLNSKYSTELITSNDSFEIEDEIHGKHLTFQYKFID